MNWFYWHEGIPDKEGWYLCAWQMGKHYIYDIGKWNGKEWFTNITAEPNLFHKITSPDEYFAELDKEAEDRQAVHITASDEEDQDSINHFPFLGTN